MTNSWTDIRNTDMVLIMGGNAAEAHPCGFKWVVDAMKRRKAKLLVVDPRFTRSAAVADFYAPIRVGTDIALLGCVINYLLTNDKIHHEYVKKYTDSTFIVKDTYKFDNGFFSGYDEAKRAYDKSSWGYEMGDDGYIRVDDTLQHPRCVYQLLKHHYSRYTPEMVGMICAHFGVALFIAGVMIVESTSIERDVRMAPEQTVSIGSLDFRFDGVHEAQGPNYVAEQGVITVLQGGREIAVLHPQKRQYMRNSQVQTEAALRPSLLRDVYIALGEPVGDDGAWAVRVYIKPFVRWIWIGGFMMALGGLLAASDPRYRRLVARERQMASQAPRGVEPAGILANKGAQ